MKLVLLILLCMGIIGCLAKLYPTQSLKIWNKVLMNARTLIKPENQSVSEECCHRMRHLASELSRKQRVLRIYKKSVRVRMIMPTAHFDWESLNVDDYLEVENLDLSVGQDTLEWEGQSVKLWGVLPLWRTTPSPDVVQSLEIPQPGDCWPFSGKSGSLHMHLPAHLAIKRISLEHIRPDTAKSAPARFELYGVYTNGTKVILTDAVYRSEGPAKQFFPIHVHDKLAVVILNVKSNQGNPKYTCIYRIQLFTTLKDYNDGIWNV